MAVFVIDKNKKPLMPCSEKRAKLLLTRNKAVVHKHYPFTIRLKERVLAKSILQPLRIKLDPGSKSTGLAINLDNNRVETVLFLAEIQHRGLQIKKALESRRSLRSGRRARKTRYRQARFNNRTRSKGWLAPSLQHRVDTVVSWVSKLTKITPISFISMELVRFDMQLMQNPEISGVEYQQGELQGYEVREYLLNKFKRQCTYCSKKDVPLQIEHVVAKANGGSNRISNLCLSCQPCNTKKGTKSIEIFLAKNPTLLASIKKQLKTPLRDAAAVNSTRKVLLKALESFNLPIETASGVQTKFNRIRFNIPKTHALDAACVGDIVQVKAWNLPTFVIKCTGRGSYQRTRVDKFGFPRGYLMREKSAFGFQTGDMVTATISKGNKAGTYQGRVAIRATGNFNIQTKSGLIQGISYKYCNIVSKADGYGYSTQPKIELTIGGSARAAV